MLGRLFRRRKEQGTERKASVGQGILYLYLIIALQVVFVFGLMAVIITIGKIVTTPLWVFVMAFATGVAGCMFIYKKAKEQLRKLRGSLQRTDLSGRNYEISIMGGVLTMRVEHNPTPLLEDKRSGVIETESVETPAAH